MSPDPKTVREIARDCVADYLGDAYDIAAHVIGHFGPGAPDDLYPWITAVRADLAAAAATWPDEQQPADVVTAEQQQDGAAEALRAWLASRTGDDQLGQDVRAVLDNREQWRNLARSRGAERDALAARVAKLRDEREADTQAVMRCQRAKAGPDAVPAMLALDARFADRIAALDATDTEES